MMTASLGLTAVVALSLLAGKSLEPGDPAPDFVLPGSDGEIHRLSGHLGKEVVILAWFPKAFTGG